MSFELNLWNRKESFGICFASSTTFRLSNNAIRKADLTWMNNATWNKLTFEEQTKFPTVCPEFVLELMSNTDNLKDSQKKMTEEWMNNGCKLA